MINLLRRALLVACTCLVGTSALAAYPDKPVRLIVPWAAGTPADVIVSIGVRVGISDADPWADPLWRQRYLNPDPLVSGRWVRTGGTKSENWRWVPDAFTYSRHDPIWAAMGLTPPTWDPPAPRAAAPS